MSAQRAYEVGLVNRVVPSAEVFDTAVALAKRIAGNAPVAVQNIQRLMKMAAFSNADTAWDELNTVMGPVAASADAMEGARAFAERRSPQWSGQ